MTTMANPRMITQISSKPGFLAALDQSGGSTPGALKAYGIPDSAYSGDEEMFRLMHQMRVRIMTSPAFTGDKIIGAILFEKTMDGESAGPDLSVGGQGRGPVPQDRQGSAARGGRRQHAEADARSGRAAGAGGQAR